MSEFESLFSAEVIEVYMRYAILATIDWAAVLLSLVAVLATFRFKIGMIATLALSSALGVLLYICAANSGTCHSILNPRGRPGFPGLFLPSHCRASLELCPACPYPWRASRGGPLRRSSTP
jgi:hypothetical protein